MRILSIDDSNSIRHAVRKMLEVIGAEFFEGTDGQDGLEVLEKEGPVDLILLDMEMPRLDGMGFLDAVKKDPRWKDIPDSWTCPDWVRWHLPWTSTTRSRALPTGLTRRRLPDRAYGASRSRVPATSSRWRCAMTAG